MSQLDDALSTTVSVQQKVNIGNYESADVFISISGVTADTTEEELDAVIDAGGLAYKKLVPVLRQRVQRIRDKGGI